MQLSDIFNTYLPAGDAHGEKLSTVCVAILVGVSVKPQVLLVQRLDLFTPCVVGALVELTPELSANDGKQVISQIIREIKQTGRCVYSLDLGC